MQSRLPHRPGPKLLSAACLALRYAASGPILPGSNACLCLASRLPLQCNSSPRHSHQQHRTYAATTNKNDSADQPDTGTSTPRSPPTSTPRAASSAFYFAAGYALFAKRPSRPFPPPFLSMPSSSFSDPLSTHNRALDKRNITQGEQRYRGELIRGITNGDDAVLVSDNLIAAGDGVGAWAQKERGHAALWSRLILHFWALEAEADGYGSSDDKTVPDLPGYLQRAYESTREATSPPNEWFGTTTASGALLHCSKADTGDDRATLYVTQLGDSQVLVVRPRTGDVLFKTTEQWHWFDCPRQLGTNSPDTPDDNAVTDTLDIEAGDVVLAMSDGVVDNLWEHEVVTNVVDSVNKELDSVDGGTATIDNDAMRRVAKELVRAARVIAEDPFAESPFMERAVEEGLPTEGGKLDDISVVAAMCLRRPK